MARTIRAKLKPRNDTYSNWASKNPVLEKGEMGIESDTGLFKVGNGISAWDKLAYVGGDYSKIPCMSNTEIDALCVE